MITFEPFPKLARLSRGCVITEKLDGTNAQIIVRKVAPDDLLQMLNGLVILHEGEPYEIAAASRTRLIKPGKTTDNYGFAGWVYENAHELVKLGEGRHFGEWYGLGIQRGYGLDEKRFALFNPERWPEQRVRPACVDLVPVLYDGEFSTEVIDHVMWELQDTGSVAVDGFMNPEGIVVYHSAARCSFKKTFDDNHKEQEAA